HYDFPPGVRVVLLGDGRIVVSARNELRWFDGDGRWIRTIGRDGSGPGEFRGIYFLAAQGDSIATYDLGLRRFSVFDTAGRYARGTVLSDPDQIGESTVAGWLRDGRLLLETYPAPRVGGLRRDSTLLRLGGPTGTVEVTLGRFPGVDQVIEFQ